MIKKLTINVTHLNFRIILAVVLVMPLTGINGLSILGELEGDASAHVIIFALLIYAIYILVKSHVIVPNSLIYHLLLFFLLWVFLSSLASFSNYSYVFKGRTGYNKFMLQYMLLVFFAIPVTIYFYHILSNYDSNYIFRRIRKMVLWSFWAVAVYAILELLYIFGLDFVEPLLQMVDAVIRNEEAFHIIGFDRIRSLAPEPPFLAIYFVFATPWLLSYFLTEEKTIGKYIILALILTIIYFSGSRTGLIIITVELILFSLLAFRRKVNKNPLKNIFLLSPLLLIGVFICGPYIGEKVIKKLETISITTESDLQVSSISRWGTQKAAIGIAKDHFLFGVGFGQQGFYFPQYYPDWAINGSYEIRNWKTDNPNKPWPPGFSMITRLSAETGFFGALLFISLNLLLLIKLFMLRYKIEDKNIRVFTTVIITCLVGLLINFLQFDSFRLTSYWLTIAISMILIKTSS